MRRRFSLKLRLLLRLLLLLATLGGLSRAECSEGTLICDLSQDIPAPTLCDYTNNYHLTEDGKCEQKKLENCERISFLFNSTCLLCLPGYVIDAVSQKCVKVPDDLNDDGCYRYDQQSMVCIECKESHYLNEQRCTLLITKVPNCQRHEGDGKCAECKSGFILKNKTCVFFEKVHGCRTHRDLTCDKCQTGFHLTSYSPPTRLLDDVFKSRLYKGEQHVQVWGGQNDIPFCQKRTVKFCQEFERSDLCTKCIPGYYMNEALQCVPNPLPKFEHCLMYNHELECIRCEHGYYLGGNPVKCTPVGEVENCILFHAYIDKCIQCKPESYLDTEKNLCPERTQELFEHCVKLSETADDCEQCAKDYALTKDKKKCLPLVPNCIELEIAATFEASRHECKDCGYRMAFDTDACVPGPDVNCLYYDIDTCIECTQYYFIEGKGCSKRLTENCIEIVGLDTDDCKVCSNGYFLTEQKTCSIQDRPNCMTHVSSANLCEVCEVGYYLENGQCILQKIDHCNNYEPQKHICLGCSTGFYLKNNACLKQYIENCKTYTANTNTCTSCTQRFVLNTDTNACDLQTMDHCIEYNPNDHTCTANGCQKGRYLKNGKCELQEQPFCIEYTINTNVCTKCQAGYYLEESNCIEQSVLNCVEYTYNSPNCEKCALGYELEAAPANICTQKMRGQCIIYNDTTLECEKCQIGYYLHDSNGTCIEQQVANCIKYDVDTNNCNECVANYFLNTTKNECEEFTGSNCIDWDKSSKECKECEPHYRLNDSTKNCDKLDFTDCIQYDSETNCTKCKAGMFLDGTDCIQITNPNCVEFKPNSTDCITCEAGYFEDSGNCSQQNTIDDCIKYVANKNECETCASTHIKTSSTSCEAFVMSNCAEHSASGECSSCRPTFYKTGTTCTERNVTQCIEYDGETNTCSKCAEGMENTGTACTDFSKSNCIKFDKSNGDCKACEAGYLLKDNTCTELNVSKCIEYEDNSLDCKTCQAGYYKASGQSCLAWDLEGCSEFTLNKNECEKCGMGYYKINPGDTTCTKYDEVEGCIEHNATGKCTECAKGFFFVSASNSCLKLNDSNCIEYSDDVCTECKMGFYLNAAGNNNKGECLAQNSVPGCIKYTPMSQDCTECALGYYIDGTICIDQAKEGCIKFADSTSLDCTACEAGYHLSGTDCVAQTLENCIAFSDQPNFCTECRDGYLISGDTPGTCVAISPVANCVTPLSDGTCDQCIVNSLYEDPDCNVFSGDHCLEFASDSGNCSKCKFPYMLNEDDPPVCALPTFPANCLVLNPDGSCNKCALKFEKNEDGDCIEVTRVEGCKNYDGEKKCSACIEYHEFDEEAQTCTPFTTQFCDSFDSEGVCNGCPHYYYLNDSAVCTEIGIDMCTTGGDGTCSKCAIDKEAKENVCVDKDYVKETKCVKLLEGELSEKCEKCISMYYPDPTTKLCTKVTAPCSKTNGIDQVCIDCNGAKKGDNCDEDRTLTIDPNCYGNKKDFDGRKCTDCGPGGISFDAFFGAEELTTPSENCTNAIHPETKICNQCVDGYQLIDNGDGTVTCELVPETDRYWIACIQTQPGSFAKLSDNKECAKCKDYRKHFLKDGVCMSRSYNQNRFGCYEFHEDKNVCNICVNNKYHFTTTGGEECIPEDQVTPIDHCVQYLDKTTCKICKTGYKPNDAKTECEEIDIQQFAYTRKAYGRDFSTHDPIIDENQVVANCIVYRQVLDTTIGCTKCDTGFIGIVPHPNKQGRKNYAYAPSEDSVFHYDDVISVFEKCLPDTNSYLLSSDLSDKSVKTGNCIVGVQMSNESSDGWACLRCAKDHVGINGKVTHYRDGTPIQGSYNGAWVECVPKKDPNMDRIYGGMYFSHYDNIGGYLTPSHYFGFDTCQENFELVYFMVGRMQPMFISFSKRRHLNGDPFDEAYCLNKEKIKVVEGCQFYALWRDFQTDPDLSTNDVLDNVNCIVCKPGYLAEDEKCVDYTDKCEEMDDKSKMFLGGCRKPVNTPEWGYNGQRIFSTSDEAKGEPGKCRVGSGGANCLLWKERWERTNGVVGESSSNDNGCKLKIGISDPNSLIFHHELSFDEHMRTFNHYIWMRVSTLDSDYDVDTTKAGCMQCNEGYVINYDSSLSFITCEGNGDKGDNHDYKCNRYYAETVGNCEICDNKYVTNTANGICTKPTQGGFGNCILGSNFTDKDTRKCHQCILGKAPYQKIPSEVDPENPDQYFDYSKCEDDQCQFYSDDKKKCKLCNDGKKLHDKSDINCKVDVGADTCMRLNNITGECYKCKDNKMFVTFYERDTETDEFKVVYGSKHNGEDIGLCVDYKFDTSRYQHHVFITLEFRYTKDTNTEEKQIVLHKLEDFDIRIVKNGWIEEDLKDYHCVKAGFTNIANCDEYEGPFCRKCGIGYQRKNSVECEEITIENCIFVEWNNDESRFDCVKCKGDYMLNNDGQECISRTESLDSKCFEKELDKDECLSCRHGYYLSGVECIENNTTGCGVKSRTANECVSCPKTQVPDGEEPPTCIMPEIDPKNKFCKKLAADKLSCEECQPGYYVDSGACTPMTVVNCLELDGLKNECLKCAPEKKPTSNKLDCEAKTATNCLTYHEIEDKCATCTKNYVLENDVCVEKTAVDCLTYGDGTAVEDKTKCGTCGRRNTLSAEGVCEPKTENCKKFADDSTLCVECSNFFYLKDGVCISKGNISCKTFFDSFTEEDKEKCADCESEYILNESTKQCVLNINKAGLCKTQVADSQNCESCSDDMKLSDNQCVLKDATFCKTFATGTTNECATCGTDFYTDDDGNCVRHSFDNCLTWDTSNGECATCKDHFEKVSGACEANDATKCKSFANWTKNCQDCEYQFKLDGGNKNCVVKTAENCTDFSTSADQCTATCPLLFYLNTTTCETRTVSNCKSFTSNEDKCTDCEEWYYKDNNFSCVRRNPNHCLTFVTTDNDHCASCSNDMVLEGNVCVENTGSNCLTFQINTHGCATCGSKFYMDANSDCQPKDSENCLTFKSTSDNGCDTCETEFWVKNGDNCTAKSKTACKTRHATLDQCATCGTLFTIDGSGTCTKRSADLCEAYVTDISNDECLSCTLGFTNSGSNCVENDEASCRTFKDGENKCETCNEDFYVFDNGSCVPKIDGNLQCKTFEAKTNKCADCSDVMKLQDGDKNCVKKEAEFCKELSTTEDKCTQCGPYFYLSSQHCTRDDSTYCLEFDGTQKGCAQCGKEYTINDDKTCSKNPANLCLTFKDSSKECETCSHDRILNEQKECGLNQSNLCLTFKNNEEGCATCSDHFYQNDDSCHQISPKNCNSYLTEENKCNQCLPTSVKDQGDNHICKRNTSLNCEGFKTDTNGCQLCSKGFYLKDKECHQVTAQGCKTWVSQENKCDECLEGYTKRGDDCEKQHLPNCSVYVKNDFNNCDICDPLFHRVIENNKGVCKKNTNFSCRSYVRNTNDCHDCITGYASPDINGDVACHPYTVKNCAAYLPRNDLCSVCIDSSYKDFFNSYQFLCQDRQVTNCFEYHGDRDKCKSCNQGEYLTSADLCEKVFPIDKCVLYSTTENHCVECTEGYFIDKTINKCTKNPIGIPDCQEYDSSLKCTKCQTNCYLDSETGKCIQVQTLIPKCIHYGNAINCEICEEGYLLFENECLLPTIGNCLEFQTPSTCSVCHGNYFLNSETSRCDYSEIDNCAEAKKDNGNIFCGKCEDNYILSTDQTKCSKIMLNIPNCSRYGTYQSKPVCTQCEDNYVLSKELDECVLISMFNLKDCIRGFHTILNRCEECHPGYDLNENFVCMASKVANCALKDPVSDACQICLPGSYMDSKGECKGTPDIEISDPVDDGSQDNDPEDPTRASVDLIRYLKQALIILILVTWF